MVLPLEKALLRLPAELGSPGRALLRRSFLQLRGPDAQRFLQGLSTSDLLGLHSPGFGQYTAFLSPQGRMLFDGFIWRVGEEEYLVEADRRIGDDLYFHLKQYRLRSKVELEPASQHWHVRASWNDPAELQPPFRMLDPRGGLGMKRDLLGMGLVEDSNAHLYNALRFAFGIPEGPAEIPRTQAIPLEYGLDLLGAVSYTKGCYLGQELVARTHNRGVIRKRIMPVALGEEKEVFVPEADCTEALGTDIIPEGGTEKERIGTVISTNGNLGMALVRVDAWEPARRYHAARSASMLVRPGVPHWWPHAIHRG